MNAQLVIFESFIRYCKKVIHKATTSDVFRVYDELHVRAKDLYDMTLDNVLAFAKMQSTPSDIVCALAEDTISIGRYIKIFGVYFKFVCK